MRWIVMAGLLAGCAGLAQEPGTGDGGQCSCPAGPTGPQGPAGPKGERGEKGEPGEAGAAGDRSPWRSGSRLTLLTLKGEDGSEMPSGRFWDERLGFICYPLELEGQLRCVPLGIPPEEEYRPEDLALFFH